MVARFVGLTSRQSPVIEPSISDPSPYTSDLRTPVPAAAETDIVSTTTSTHFFSRPLWRKRVAAPTYQGNLDVDGHIITSENTRSYVPVDKDLPQTPSRSHAHHAESDISPDYLLKIETQRNDTTVPTYRDDLWSRTPSREFLPSMQSAAALAHASLGLGLSHVLPHVSPSSSSSEVNTVAFTQPLLSGSSSRIRKTKSTQKLSAASPSPTSTKAPLLDNRHQRSRGLSFSGPASLHLAKNEVTEPDTRERAGSSNMLPAFPTIPKSLARRASFWTRKKSITPGPSLPITPTDKSSTSHISQLPVLQPISPLNMGITITPSSPSTVQYFGSAHSRGLSRSYSARSDSRPMSVVNNHTSTARLFSKIESPAPTSHEQCVDCAHPILLPTDVEKKNTSNRERPAPKRRPRAQTNPPLLNRLSLGWLSPSSTHPPPLPRLSHQSTTATRPHTSSGIFSTSSSKGQQEASPSITESLTCSNSPRSSSGNGSCTTAFLPYGKEETLDVYLKRLQTAVGKAEVAGVLASRHDPFYAQALRAYIGQFNFVDDPLDVSLRKLLMDVGLPRETQQIDRVIEAFASRYLQCNPGLFLSDDHPYILAFSLIMLHTDAFNKSNKRKMSKLDYIKNTLLPGVAPEVLDCFYDNIVFAPFIFIEDPLDTNGQSGLASDLSQLITASGSLTAPLATPVKATKVDPYFLITNDLLGSLRVDVEAFVPKDNPYSYEGTAGPWDDKQLQFAFATATQVGVNAAVDGSRTSPFFSLGGGTSLTSPVGKSRIVATPVLTAPSNSATWTLKLTKVGHLNRKDDVLENGKKALNRKWKQWSVVLTSSQLLFFRDPSLATSLSQFASSDHPQSTLLKPDEMLSVKGAIAVYDKAYTRHQNTFRILMADGRQLLLQAFGEKELNEWLARINYASAFKTVGVRMRPPALSRVDIKLTGVAAANSHLHDLQNHSPKFHTWNCNPSHDPHSKNIEIHGQRPKLRRKLTITTGRDDMELETPVAPEIDGAEQLKATFHQVKADLVAGRSPLSLNEGSHTQQSPLHTNFNTPPMSETSAFSEYPFNLSSRTQVIQSEIDNLDLRLTAAQSQLDASMRFVHNIATLTPFQKSTRDRLTTTVQNVAQRIMQVRLEITKLVCHRHVLINDLISEERSWHQANAIALQAANDTLQNIHGSVRRMVVSEPPTDRLDIQNSNSYHLDTWSIRGPEPSICDSFYSALDFGPDWPSTEDASSSFLGANYGFEPTSTNPSPSSVSHSTCDNSAGSPGRNSVLLPTLNSPSGSPRSSRDILSHERFYTALEDPEEEAETWNQTRCAQRVSLVRLPSDIQLKARFGPDKNL